MMRIRSSSTMAVMVSDLDIYRGAKLLVDQHGEDAPPQGRYHALLRVINERSLRCATRL